MDLGERIATLREEQALTQVELAERARISASTLSQIETGRVPRPHVGTVRKIARALGVEPVELRRTAEPVLVGKAEAPEAKPGQGKPEPVTVQLPPLEASAELRDLVRDTLEAVRDGRISVEEGVERMERIYHDAA